MLLHLQNKLINPSVIELLEHWFTICSIKVKWNDQLSEPVALTAGVRQGGIISPLLFSSYVNSVLTSLDKSKIGCFINGNCLNSFLYADDLLLLSISVSDLQSLTNKCISIFVELDLQINSSKSCCLRIGPRLRLKCSPISVKGSRHLWSTKLNT